MASIASSRRYAQAIMELALQNNDLAAWQRDLALLQEVWADPVIRAYLDDVRLSKEKRLERVRQTLGNRLSPLSLNFVLLLMARGRSALLPYIVRQFDELVRQRERIEVARITSAQPLLEEQRTTIRAQLERQTGKDIQLEEVVDPAIMGGLVIQVGDQLLDLSIAGRLRRMREQVVGRYGVART